MKDTNFEDTLSDSGKVAWIDFYNVVIHFLGNNQSPNNEKSIKDMLQKFRMFNVTKSTF